MNGPISSPTEPGQNTAPKAATDEMLMLAFSHGLTDAFSELYRRYHAPIFGFFRRRVLELAQAEELTQETFLAVIRTASHYVPRALFRTYIYAIALKLLRATRRKAAFRALLLGPGKSSAELAAPGPSESALWVRRAIAKLDATDREVVLLREFEQLSYAEIADLLKIPLNTVRSRLFRARMALRELLEPDLAQETAGIPNGSKNTTFAAPLAVPNNTAKGDRA